MNKQSRADNKRTTEEWRQLLDERNRDVRRITTEARQLRDWWRSQVDAKTELSTELKEANARIADLESKLTTTENFLSNSEGNILRLNGSVAMADKDFDKLLDRLVVLDAFKKETHGA